MEKRSNRYTLDLALSAYADGSTTPERKLQLSFTNHDELFSIIQLIAEKNIFAEPQQSTEFAIGLKLFTEVMLKNRNHPIFEELAPAIATFMKKLKST